MCGRKVHACSLAAQMDGGGHERGMRSGTLNVPGIVGLGKACEICAGGDAGRIETLGRFCATSCRIGIMKELDEVYMNGHPEEPVAE